MEIDFVDFCKVEKSVKECKSIGKMNGASGDNGFSVVVKNGLADPLKPLNPFFARFINKWLVRWYTRLLGLLYASSKNQLPSDLHTRVL